MQTFYRYTLPAILLVLLLSATGLAQPASSAAIQATATVVAPVGVASFPEPNDDYAATTTGLFVLCPTEVHVLVTVDESNRPIHSRELADVPTSILAESGQPALRVIDCSYLSPSTSLDSTAVITVIVTEN